MLRRGKRHAPLTLTRRVGTAREWASGLPWRRMTTSTHPKLVLVADDYDHAAALIANLVELATPHEGISALDGKQALALALQRRPDACLLDLDMPRMGGMETARQLRAAFAERRPLLIAMTGGGAYLEAVQSGLFDEVMGKPLDMGRLLALLALM